MTVAQAIFASCGLLITIFSFSFGIFWKIIKDTENSINKKIDSLKEDKDETHKKIFDEISIVKEKINDKTAFSYVDGTFTRKDTHAIEYAHVLKSLQDLNAKIDQLLNEKESK